MSIFIFKSIENMNLNGLRSGLKFTDEDAMATQCSSCIVNAVIDWAINSLEHVSIRCWNKSKISPTDLMRIHSLAPFRCCWLVGGYLLDCRCWWECSGKIGDWSQWNFPMQCRRTNTQIMIFVSRLTRVSSEIFQEQGHTLWRLCIAWMDCRKCRRMRRTSKSTDSPIRSD